MDEMRGENLREALAQCRRGVSRGPYPGSLRHKAQEYARARYSEGASFGRIATELGVPVVTATAWARSRGSWESKSQQDVSLVPVVLRPERVPEPMAAPQVHVEFADGTRVQASGWGPKELVQVLHALRGKR